MKKEQKQAIRDRAESCLLDLYHNATPNYPTCYTDQEAEIFQGWLAGEAEFEIDHLNSGGAYLEDQKMAGHFALRYKNDYAKCRAAMRKYRAGKSWDQSRWGRYERIIEYGRLYTWGRGGRTLAPDGLIRQRGGGSFSIDTTPAQEWPIRKVVDLILTVEAFNRYVTNWNRGIPQGWKEYADENPDLFSDPKEEECHI